MAGSNERKADTHVMHAQQVTCLRRASTPVLGVGKASNALGDLATEKWGLNETQGTSALRRDAGTTCPPAKSRARTSHVGGRCLLERQNRQRHGVYQCYQALSRREHEMLRLVAVGRLNKQVGFELGISEITIKAHRGSMMRKMRAGALAELVRMVADLLCESDDRYVAPQTRTTFQNGRQARDVASRRVQFASLQRELKDSSTGHVLGEP